MLPAVIDIVAQKLSGIQNLQTKNFAQSAFGVWISWTIWAFPTFNSGKMFKGKKDTTTVSKKVAVEQLTASPWNNLVFKIYYGMVIDGKSVLAHLRLTTLQCRNPI